MLHRTLANHGGEVAKAGSSGHASAAKKLIPGSAGYYNRTDLGWVHGHREMNYRKKPLGMKAYNKANMDIFEPFANKWPYRHQETSTPGLWFAGGHFGIFAEGGKAWGAMNWPLWNRSMIFMVVPFIFQYGANTFRYAKGGYVTKNAGAVFGA